ncbi:MAG: undecaprenyl/decaprenyl-phosphate alpha-N-acetylglucosaminyl 1-phosphate transferase [Sedimentisphaerales bacterium]|nr:undecaprenyl/decaprenyl-phosphate alpha-N-acetylglucosaminyl 1-phosphate transferase [Sedimentisphaerales bacterium]
MKTYLAVYFGSALVAMLIVPFVFRLAKRYSLFDNPGPRKMHSAMIPRIGGISFVAGSLALIVPVFFLNNGTAEYFRNARIQYIALLSGSVFMYLIGLLDDFRSMRGTVKLLCLVAAALVFYFSGAAIRTIQLGPSLMIHTGWAALPLTVCWIVIITICIGVIDGLDGLAAGIAAMVCGTMVILSLFSGQAAMVVLMLSLLGGITGFLIFNFYPAKIFMGDGGSLFLGFMIGAGSVLCQSTSSAFLGLALPFLVLGMPILDTGLVVTFRGFIKRRSLFAPDNNHFHHRLLKLGLKHRSVVLIMYAITAICASLGIFMIRAEGNLSVELLVAGIVLLFTMFACLQKGRYLKLFRGLRRNLIIASQVKKQTRSFETAEIKMNESASFALWWRTLCMMGEDMRFQSLSLLHRDNGRYSNTCLWNTSKNESGKKRALELNLPLDSGGAGECMLRVHIYVDDYLELSGHQVHLLTRYIDEFPLPKDCLSVESADELLNQDNISQLTYEHDMQANGSETLAGSSKAPVQPDEFAGHIPVINSIKALPMHLSKLLKEHRKENQKIKDSL